MATMTWYFTEQDGDDWTNSEVETDVETRTTIEEEIEDARETKYGG